MTDPVWGPDTSPYTCYCTSPCCKAPCLIGSQCIGCQIRDPRGDRHRRHDSIGCEVSSGVEGCHGAYIGHHAWNRRGPLQDGKGGGADRGRIHRLTEGSGDVLIDGHIPFM